MDELLPTIKSMKVRIAFVLCLALSMAATGSALSDKDSAQAVLAQLEASSTQPSEMLAVTDIIMKLGKDSQSDLFSFVNSPTSSEPLRTKVILLLCFCSNKSGVVKCFAESILTTDSYNAVVETGAVSGLARNGHIVEETRVFISAALQRRESEVLSAVIRLAIAQNDQAAVGRLTEIGCDSRGFDQVTRARAIRAASILTRESQPKKREDLLHEFDEIESVTGITDELNRARALLAEPKATGNLIAALDSTDEEARYSAITTLAEIKGDDLGYHFNDDAAKRRLAVDRWRKWNGVCRNIDGTAAK